MAHTKGLSGLEEGQRPHELPGIDEDPVLARVQMGLLAQGDEISKIVMSGGASNNGGDVMNALIHLMSERPQTPPAMTSANSSGGSSAGAIVAGSLGALATGLGVAGSFMGKPGGAALKTASVSVKKTPPPPPDRAAKADQPAKTVPPEAPKETPKEATAEHPADNPPPAKNNASNKPAPSSVPMEFADGLMKVGTHYIVPFFS